MTDNEIVLKAINEFDNKSQEEIQKEMMGIIKTWKHFSIKTLANKANVTPATIYQITKRCVKYRPSFETYIKIKAVGKNIYAE